MHRHVATTAMLHVVTTGQDHHRVASDKVRHRVIIVRDRRHVAIIVTVLLHAVIIAQLRRHVATTVRLHANTGVVKS